MKKNKPVTFEGTTVEEAIEAALSQMNVSREKIKVKVVCEEKKGLFGMAGEKPAKIIVTLREDPGSSEPGV